MSRKYHKLVVVPLKATTGQLYAIQQRLLSVLNPRLVSSAQQPSVGRLGGGGASPATAAALALNGNQVQQLLGQSKHLNRTKRDYLLPGFLIIENQPLLVGCNITDEFVLRKLRENPQFQLAWYKNGKQLRGSMASLSNPAGSTNQAPGASRSSSGGQLAGPRTRQQVGFPVAGVQMSPTQSRPFSLSAGSQRVQFLAPNGRQLYITSALYSDAGDYLCSWSKLPSRQVSRPTFGLAPRPSTRAALIVGRRWFNLERISLVWFGVASVRAFELTTSLHLCPLRLMTALFAGRRIPILTRTETNSTPTLATRANKSSKQEQPLQAIRLRQATWSN